MHDQPICESFAYQPMKWSGSALKISSFMLRLRAASQSWRPQDHCAHTWVWAYTNFQNLSSEYSLVFKKQWFPFLLAYTASLQFVQHWRLSNVTNIFHYGRYEMQEHWPWLSCGWLELGHTPIGSKRNLHGNIWPLPRRTCGAGMETQDMAIHDSHGLGSSSEIVGYLGRILMQDIPYILSTFVVSFLFRK